MTRMQGQRYIWHDPARRSRQVSGIFHEPRGVASDVWATAEPPRHHLLKYKASLTTPLATVVVMALTVNSDKATSSSTIFKIHRNASWQTVK